MEVFREIKGFDGKYLVSNLGRVKSKFSYKGTDERILKQYKHKNTDYLFVRLFVEAKNRKTRQKYKNYDVHRLVAETFIENPEELGYVNHKDENKQNNHADNLEWCTAKYNSNYGSIKERTCKRVGKYDLEGNLLETYSSVTEAGEKNHYYKGNISSCCNGNFKTAYGYVWKHLF